MDSSTADPARLSRQEIRDELLSMAANLHQRIDPENPFEFVCLAAKAIDDRQAQ